MPKEETAFKAESLVNLAKAIREQTVTKLKKYFQNIKDIFERSLIKLNNVESIEGGINILLGEPKDTSNTEPFFIPYDWTFAKNKILVLDSERKVQGLFSG